MDDIILNITHYQRKLQKYAATAENSKVIYYLSKLKHMPIKVAHLEQTGVGRSVNALRHSDGQVGERARNLVGMWKKMVTAEEDCVPVTAVPGQPLQSPSTTTTTSSAAAAAAVSSTSSGSVGGGGGGGGGDGECSVSSSTGALPSPRPSKQRPPTHHTARRQQSQSPEEYEEEEEEEDANRLQIEERDYQSDDDGTMEKPSSNVTGGGSPSVAAASPTTTTPHGDGGGGSGGSPTSGYTGGKYGGQPLSCSSEEDRYDPHTSKRDYESLSVNYQPGRSAAPVQYQPTTIVASVRGVCEDEDLSTEDLEAEQLLHQEVSGGEGDQEMELSRSSNHKRSKSKHRERSKEKKPKTHSKEREGKEKHKHKTTEKDKEHRGSKDKNHKEKRREKEKEQEQSPTKKSQESSKSQRGSSAEALDRRRSKNTDSSESSSNSKKTDIIPDVGSPVNSDSQLVNGHESSPPVVSTHKTSSTSSKNKSGDKTSSTREERKSEKHRKEKEKKEKKKGKETQESKEEGGHHKVKKRKLGDASNEGFAAALMGVDSSTSKKKKSKSDHSKEEKSRKSKSSSKDRSENHNSNKTPKNSKSSSSKGPSKSNRSKHNVHNSSDINNRETEDTPDDLSLLSVEPRNDLDMLPDELEVDNFPDIDPNYKPLPRIPLRDEAPPPLLDAYPSYIPPYQKPPPTQLTQEEALTRMMTSKSNRMRIYSGKATGCSEVTSLFKLCVRCLQENIDEISVTGGVPYDILKPVLERASGTQLFKLENYNPYLLDDTHLLWEVHCKKDFKGKKPDEMETWRDLHIRLTDERKEKFKSLTENLKGKFVTAPAPRRMTQLAFVNTVAKPPKSVARAQAKYGTGVPTGTPAKMTKAAETAARKQMYTNVQRNEKTLNNNASRVSTAKKPKAPLMAKTMQFYKKTFRR